MCIYKVSIRCPYDDKKNQTKLKLVMCSYFLIVDTRSSQNLNTLFSKRNLAMCIALYVSLCLHVFVEWG